MMPGCLPPPRGGVRVPRRPPCGTLWPSVGLCGPLWASVDGQTNKAAHEQIPNPIFGNVDASGCSYMLYANTPAPQYRCNFSQNELARPHVGNLVQPVIMHSTRGGPGASDNAFHMF